MPPASNNISEVVEKLRRLSQVEVQSGWRYCDADSSAVGSVGISNGEVVELNEKRHIAWPSGKQVVCLGQKFVIPENLHGYPVAGLRLLLSLTWWAEDATIFVNGELVGQGDLFDCADRVLLSASVNPGDEFLVVLRLVSPGHDNGALVRSICLYEAADYTCFDPSFVADELEILQSAIDRNLGNEDSQDLPVEILASRRMYVKGERLQSGIDWAVGLIDWSALPDRAKFDRSLSVLRHNLLGYLRAFSGELDDLTAEGAEGAEGGSREKLSRVSENTNSTSIGESLNFTSFSGELDDLTAEGAEGAEGGSREKLSRVSENTNSTSIYIGETGDIAFLDKVMHSRANHQLPITNSPLSIPNSQSRADLLENCHTSIYIGKIYLVGHAHLDLAWLWPVPETWEAAERTFESVLKLQSEFPDLIFCHSTPALYAWMEEHRPDLFAAIQKQVAAGCWEVVGGMWVEPDLNLISAESMVRQVFYGQRYAKEKFGELMRVAWLPDTFGFGWQLPQIWRQGGVDYFVTQKLRWNDSTQFPHGAFWWEGLDGTKIFSMMSGAIGENIESVKMASHAFDWQVKTGLQDALWLPGVGDHGGGPTRDMLEVAKRWKLSPFFPRLEFIKAVDYLSLIESQFLPEVAEVDSISDVSQSPSRESLPIPKVVETLSDVAPPNLLENSATSSESQRQLSEKSASLPITEVVETWADVISPNLPENSATLPGSRTSTQETPESLPIPEVVKTWADVISPNLLENSTTLPESLNSNLKTPASLPIPEVVEPLSDVASGNSTTLPESLNSNLKTPASLPIPEVVKTWADVISPNLLENSTTLPESLNSNLKTPASLPIPEVVEPLSDVASGNSATLPESLNSNLKTPASLPIPEVVEPLSGVASGKLLENSATLSESQRQQSEKSASLPIPEVVETLSDVAPPNLLENSATLSESLNSYLKTPANLPIPEVVETLSGVASGNFLENSATLPGSRTSTQETPASLPISGVVETLSDVAPPNLLENFASLPDSLDSNLKNTASLPISGVVETLSDVASEKLLENSASLPESLNSNLKNPASLPISGVVETLSGVASGNFASLPDSLDSNLKNLASLPIYEVVEALSDVAPPNLLEKSASLPESLNSNLKNPASLPISGVVETLSDVASEKLLENSATLSESQTNSAKNKENLQLRKTTENLSGLTGDFSSKISESESKYLDFPTEIHQEKSQLKNSPNLPLSPNCQLSTVNCQLLNPSPPLPIWKDELYLEFHRGCYTTRADQKRQNRRCEDLLYQAELLSSIATICTGAVYPKVELESAWKQVLFNQFHDILPGSAIAQVYTDANLAFDRVDRTCRHILLQSLDAIAAQISLPSPPQPDAQPIFVFNSLNWSRSEVVALTLTLPDSPDWAWQIYDLSGQRLTSQIVKGDPQSTLLFSADSVPAIGYRVFWLCRQDAQTVDRPSVSSATEKKTYLSKLTYGIAQKNTPCQETHFPAPEMVLENELIRATVDAETGNLSSIWDKANNREVLNAVGGNQLQAFQDSGQYWDAWNIDPNYQKYPLPAPILKQISWVDRGEVRQSLRVVMQIGKSEFRQNYIVEVGSPLLKIKTVVDWQETHVLVKTAFGLNVAADFATCEIPGGAIARSTKPQTPAEKAKWEVPIFRWTDISNDGFGVSLLNDCKYGCDIQPNQIRLTLLRSSTWPDEQADKGVSEFTCAVYPHAGNWQEADTVRHGYELNLPLLVKVLPKLEESRHKSLPAVGKFLDLSAENLVLMAFKQSEDNPNLWILRCYECHGQEAKLELNSDLGLAISHSVDLLEQPVDLPQKSGDGKTFKISPWKIASFAVNL